MGARPGPLSRRGPDGRARGRAGELHPLRTLVAVALVALLGCSGRPDAPDAGRDGGGGGGGSGGGAGGGGGGGGYAQDSGFDAGSPDAGTIPRWGNVQWPPFATLEPGGKVTVYGQVWVEGRSSLPGATAGLVAELGVGPSGSDPSGSGWSWVAAAYNAEAGNNDEFKADLTAPAGVYDYAFRYRLDGAWSGWLYADRSDSGRGGTNDGYRPDDAGKLAVRSSGASLEVATQNLHCLEDDPRSRLDAIAARLASVGSRVVALQEVCTDSSPSAVVADAAQYLAAKLSAATGKPWRHFFAQTHLFQNQLPEGVGLLASLPVADTAVKDLPTADFPRKALLAVLASEVGMVAITSVHFSYASTPQAAQARVDQANAVLAFAGQWQSGQVAASVVGGDLNATPTDSPTPVSVFTSAGFIDAWEAKNPGQPGLTFANPSPTRRIDYLFVRFGAAGPVSVSEARVEFSQPYDGGSFVSDHRGVSALIAVP